MSVATTEDCSLCKSKVEKNGTMHCTSKGIIDEHTEICYVADANNVEVTCDHAISQHGLLCKLDLIESKQILEEKTPEIEAKFSPVSMLNKLISNVKEVSEEKIAKEVDDHDLPFQMGEQAWRKAIQVANEISLDGVWTTIEEFGMVIGMRKIYKQRNN